MMSVKSDYVEKFTEVVYEIVREQTVEVVYGVISITTIITMFGIYYLYSQVWKWYSIMQYYKFLYGEKYCNYMELEDRVEYMRRKNRVLEIRLNNTKEELKGMKNGMIIRQEDKEKIADRLVEIISSLPDNTVKAKMMIKDFADIFDISISYETDKKRKQQEYSHKKSNKKLAFH